MSGFRYLAADQAVWGAGLTALSEPFGGLRRFACANAAMFRTGSFHWFKSTGNIDLGHYWAR